MASPSSRFFHSLCPASVEAHSNWFEGPPELNRGTTAFMRVVTVRGTFHHCTCPTCFSSCQFLAELAFEAVPTFNAAFSVKVGKFATPSPLQALPQLSPIPRSSCYYG